MGTGTVGMARTVVLRQTGAVLIPVAVWALCVLALADAVVEGTPTFAVRVGVVASAVAWAVWVGLASPCMVVERAGLRIINPLRTHWVPYGALDEVRVRGLTSVTARHVSGRLRSITSWNAPGVPLRYTAAAPPVATVIEHFRSDWEQRSTGDTEALATTSWRWRPALALLALVAASIAIWLR